MGCGGKTGPKSTPKWKNDPRNPIFSLIHSGSPDKSFVRSGGGDDSVEKRIRVLWEFSGIKGRNVGGRQGVELGMGGGTGGMEVGVGARSNIVLRDVRIGIPKPGKLSVNEIPQS